MHPERWGLIEPDIEYYMDYYGRETKDGFKIGDSS